MKATGFETAPIARPPYYSRGYYGIFFVIWILFGAFFLQSMFVGVVISAWNREAEKLGNNLLLSEED